MQRGAYFKGLDIEQLKHLEANIIGRFDARIDQVVALLSRMDLGQSQIVSANLITVPPNLQNWQGRNTELTQQKAWLDDCAIESYGQCLVIAQEIGSRN